MSEQRDFETEIAKADARFTGHVMGTEPLSWQNSTAMLANIADLQRQYIEELKAENLHLRMARVLLSRCYSMLVAVESNHFPRPEISKLIDLLQKWNRADSGFSGDKDTP